MVAHYGLHFPNDEGCQASFYVPVGHLYMFFREMSICALCQFLNRVIWLFVAEL